MPACRVAPPPDVPSPPVRVGPARATPSQRLSQGQQQYLPLALPSPAPPYVSPNSPLGIFGSYMAMNQRLWILLSLCIVASALALHPSAFAPPAALAEPSRLTPPNQLSSTECNGLDLLVIIDQSDSMGTTDAEAFRVVATRNIIHLLGFNRLHSCPDVVHRVGVLSFGDGAEAGDGSTIDLPFTEIAPNSVEQWRDERLPLEEQIQAKELGATDFATAFATGKRMFNGLGPLPGTRKQAIILLTDGSPCVSELGCPGSFAPGSYLQRLRSQIEQDFPFQEGVGTYIWVVAMRDRNQGYLADRIGPPISATMGDYWAGIANSHGGALEVLSRNRNEIPLRFHQSILSRLLVTGNLNLLECGPHSIQPYTERVNLLFYKNDPSLVVTISHRVGETEVLLQNGQSSHPDLISIRDYTDDEFIERYEIYRPDPGVWVIAARDCGDEVVEILQETIQPRITLIEPEAPVRLVDGSDALASPSPLIYQITESGNGQAYPEHPNYPLSVQVTISDPKGITTTLALQPDDAQAATYRSEEPLPANELGEHRVALVGQTRSVEGTPLVIFNTESIYSVYTEIRDFDFQLIQPLPDGVAPLNQPGEETALPLQVSLRLVDLAGNLLDPTRVFSDSAESWFALTLRGEQQQQALTASVRPDPTNPGHIVAIFDGATTEGSYTLEASMTGQHRADRYRPLRDRATFAFRRVRSEFFDLAIVSPQADTEQSLNRVEGGSDLLLPVTVQVQVVDQAGNPLDPADIFPDPMQALQATLYGPSQSNLGTVPLVPDSTAPGTFTAELPGEDREGVHRLQVDLIGTPPQGRYQPLIATRSVNFERVRTQPFTFRIVAPTEGQELMLHQSGQGCIAGAQVWPGLEVEMDQNPHQVLASAPITPTARLIAPNGAVEEIALEIVERPDGPRVVGMAQSIPALSGKHSFEVTFGPQSVNARFAPLTSTHQVAFARNDTLVTSPTACRAGAGALGLLTLALLGLIAWLSIGGPTGTLALVDGSGNPVAGPWKLSPFPRFQKKRSNQLAALGIKELSIRRADPIDPEAPRAISVEARNSAGEIFIPGMLLDSSPYPQPFVDGAEIRYE